MTSYRACLLCGHQGGQPIELVVVRWIEPQAGRIFDALPRCVDRGACRARVEASGERWEVADGTPASGAAPSSQPEPSMRAQDQDELAEAFG